MYNLDYFDNKLLICPLHIKADIIKQARDSNKLYNSNYLTIEEFYKRFTFDYDSKAIMYIMNKYQVKVEVALIYLNNLRYLVNIIDDEKIKFLNSLKEDLHNQGLLVYDKSFIPYLNSKQVLVYGYTYLERKYLMLLNELHHFKIITPKVELTNPLTCYEFETIEDEVVFVLNNIVRLLKDGIDINKIKIAGISSEYNFILKMLSDVFNVPIMVDDRTPIHFTFVVHEFLNLIDTNEEESLEYLQSNQNQSFVNIVNLIIKVINKYPWRSNLKEIKHLLIHDFKNTYLHQEYSNVVKVESLTDTVFNDDEHVFVLGFNQGNIPFIHKDEDYLSDETKRTLKLDDSQSLNKIEKQKVLNSLSKIKNLFITYKLKSSFNEYFPTNLISDYQFTVIKDAKINYNVSNLYNKLSLTSFLDTLNKYGSVNENLNDLYTTYPDLGYLSYDNRFTGIDTNLLQKELDNEIHLSYSSMNDFYKCGFLYYLTRVLKLNIYDDTFSLFIGSLYHYVLALAFKDNFNFDEAWDEGLTLSKHELSAKEKFLLIKLKKELLFIIESINSQLKYLNYQEALFEEEVVVEINDSLKITFKGIIDKLMYKEVEGQAYVAIVDYKTGSIDLNLNNSFYALNMQLPIYLYLSKRSEKLSNVKVYGFYYQTILQNEIKANSSEDYLKNRAKYIMLQGYSLANANPEAEFDRTCDDSKAIRSLKKTNGGTYYQYAKVLTTDELDMLDKLVESKIIEASKAIYNGEFDINPKVIQDKNLSCQFCRFKDICYVNFKNEVKLEAKKDLGFLRGEDDE